jgi:hypothetical protein
MLKLLRFLNISDIFWDGWNKIHVVLNLSLSHNCAYNFHKAFH